MRLILGLVLVFLLLTAGWKATGHQLPVIDYQLGPIAGPVVQPKIEVKPPGYHVNVP